VLKIKKQNIFCNFQESDDAPASDDQPKEGDPLDKYLLKDTEEFKIARDSSGRPILYSSVQAAGGIPLLYGADGHGHLIQASSDYNFSTEAVPAGEPDAVKASDLGGKFDTPRSAPEAANPPTPPVSTSLTWPHHKPVVVEENPWPAPVAIHSSGHHHGYSRQHHGHSGHHSGHPHYEHWSSEQKPVAAEAPQNGPWTAQGGAAPQADGPWTSKGGPQPQADGPQYQQRPEMPAGAYKTAPSSKFEQAAPQAFNPSSSSGARVPWESSRPDSPEGPFWNEQAFLGVSRAQPTQG